MIIGIDPGLTGAMAFIGASHEAPRLVQTPVLRRSNGKGNRIDVARVFDALEQHQVQRMIHIEKVRAMPSIRGKRTMGAQSSFNFGEGFGLIWAAAVLSGSWVHFIEAAKWKRMAGLIGQPKAASLAAAIELYPGVKEGLRHGRGHGTKEEAIGRADALLIGHYGDRALSSTVQDLL